MNSREMIAISKVRIGDLIGPRADRTDKGDGELLVLVVGLSDGPGTSLQVKTILGDGSEYVEWHSDRHYPTFIFSRPSS